MTNPRIILDEIGQTPLVALLHVAAGSASPVLGKCEHLNPGGSVKDRIALAIIDDAEARGALQLGSTIVEATAGNTGIGLALVALARGYRLACVLPKKMSEDKRKSLRLLGAEVIVTANAPPSHADNFQNVARRLAQERGWFYADQFGAKANVRVHYETTGPEILAQAGGRVGAFVAGVGTGGTGVGRFLKERCPTARIVLADPQGSVLAGWVNEGRAGHDATYAVEGIGSSVVPDLLDLSVVDEAMVVDDDESFDTARRLIREEGLLVGGSAGTAVAAALRVATRRLDGPVVALLPDAWDRYQSLDWMNQSP
jgi:cysteine synthase